MSMRGPMHASDLVFIVHRTSTRIRIKIPGRRGQKSYFEALKGALLAHPDVPEVEATLLTSSVIINCRAAFALVTQDQQFPRLKITPADVLAPVALEQSKCMPEGPIGTATVTIIEKTLDLFAPINWGRVSSSGLCKPLLRLRAAGVSARATSTGTPASRYYDIVGRGGWPLPARFSAIELDDQPNKMIYDLARCAARGCLPGLMR
jgi:hypothetical protein